MRDCENCKHRVMKVEVGKGTSPEHFWGCECWECEFEPTTKNYLAIDCISRQAVIDLMMQKWGENFSGDDAMQESMDDIRALPPVTPQEPRKGHWIDISKYKNIAWQCSECEHFTTMKHNYCPNCGAKMVEPQESEDKA